MRYTGNRIGGSNPSLSAGKGFSPPRGLQNAASASATCVSKFTVALARCVESLTFRRRVSCMRLFFFFLRIPKKSTIFATVMRIVFTTSLPEAGFTRLAGHELVFPTAAYCTREELMERIVDAEILVATFDYKVDSEVLERAQRLRYIANFGSGYNNIDVAYCAAHGILVTNTPAPVVEPTAEHALALMLGIAHRVAELDARLRAPHPHEGGVFATADEERRSPRRAAVKGECLQPVRFGVMENLGVSLYGKTLGIVGLGNIGKALARRAQACGMRIIYHNRKPIAVSLSPLGINPEPEYVSMDELLRTADFVSLNLPYTPETHHLISTAELEKMKPTAILINTARGAHVDEQALIVALRDGQIAAAALDVYEHEPQIADELKALPNVLLSPHIGTGTIDGRLAMCECVSDNILAFTAGKKSEMNIV